jgi:hypothetical protein
MKDTCLSSEQGNGSDQKPKPAHAHFCSSAFLDGEGPNAFTRSSVVNGPASEHHGSIPTLEEHLKSAYQMLEM